MNWTYEQSMGWLIPPDEDAVSVGHSGSGDGKNDPDAQHLDNGPLPRGLYDIGPEYKPEQAEPQQYLSLTPLPETEMHGRTRSYRMHADSIHTPGEGSLGCLVFDLDTIQRVWRSECRVLEVVR